MFSFIRHSRQTNLISNTIGAEQVAETAIEFESQCKAGNLTADELIALRDRLDHDYADATQFIQAHIQQAQMNE